MFYHSTPHTAMCIILPFSCQYTLLVGCWHLTGIYLNYLNRERTHCLNCTKNVITLKWKKNTSGGKYSDAENIFQSNNNYNKKVYNFPDTVANKFAISEQEVLPICPNKCSFIKKMCSPFKMHCSVIKAIICSLMTKLFVLLNLNTLSNIVYLANQLLNPPTPMIWRKPLKHH